MNKLFNEKLGLNFLNVNKQIEYRKFENQKRKINFKKIFRNLVLTTTSCVLIILLLPILVFGIKVDNSFKSTYKNYTIHELNQMENELYKRLNNVKYPELYDYKELYRIDDEYVSMQNNFANKITSCMDLAKENVFYSPFSLYMNLDIMSSLTDDNELIEEFSTLLGKKQIRENNYDAMFKNNYYKVKKGTVMSHNGLFVDNNYEFNSSLIDELTKKYVEIFQLDFENEKAVKKMLDWVNNKVNSNDFLSENDLGIDPYCVMYLFSTLYFKNDWMIKFDKKDTYKDSFYGLNGTSEENFMRHSYFTEVYDYGDYLSFSDYYMNNYSIKYYVPKNIEDNIYDLIKDKNIFEDDETKLLTSNHPGNSRNHYSTVELSVPKFKLNYSLDFSSILMENGLAKAFDRERNSFNYIFSDLTDRNVFIDRVFQKNQIEIDETGTKVKTITLSGLKAGSMAPNEGNTLSIKLNQPFIYIISDSNNLPLYVGSVNNLNNK